MTIHVDGMQLTPEQADAYNNADEETKKRMQAEIAASHESVVSRLDQADQAAQRRYEEESKSLEDMGPRIDYYGEGGEGTVTPEQYGIPESPEVKGKIAPEEPTKKAPAPAGSGATVSYGGGGGLRKNEDFTQYRKERDEKRMRMREAARAVVEAQDRERQALLATGRYYEDGHGGIRLKKDLRTTKYRTQGGMRSKSVSDDGSGNAAVRKAGMEAAAGFETATNWGDMIANQEAEKAARSRQYTRAAVAANKAEMEAIEKRKAEAKANDAKGKLSIFDGITAAFGDMNRKFDRNEAGDITDEEVEVQPVEKFKRDAQGRVTTELNEPTKKKTGRRFVDGFVAPELIKTINSNLAGHGNNRVRITGIMARQRLGVDTKTKDGEPMFVVSGVRYDPQTGTNKEFRWVRSLKDVYRFGVENSVASGIDAKDAEMNVINDLGDLFGVAARANADRDAKLQIAQTRADASQNVAQINAQGRVDVAQTNAKSREEVAKFNAEAKKQIAEITARHKEAQSVNGKITGTDLAALYKVANDPLADDTVKSSALEMAEFLTDKLMNAGKAGVKSEDNTGSDKPDLSKMTREEKLKWIREHGGK